MLRLLVHFIELAESAAAVGVTPEQIAELDVMRPLARMGEDIAEGQIERLAELERRVELAFSTLVVPSAPGPVAAEDGMQPRVTVHDAAMRLDGPLLFMRRTLEVGLNEAVVVTGRDGAPRLGRALPPSMKNWSPSRCSSRLPGWTGGHRRALSR